MTCNPSRSSEEPFNLSSLKATAEFPSSGVLNGFDSKNFETQSSISTVAKTHRMVPYHLGCRPAYSQHPAKQPLQAAPLLEAKNKAGVRVIPPSKSRNHSKRDHTSPTTSFPASLVSVGTNRCTVFLSLSAFILANLSCVKPVQPRQDVHFGKTDTLARKSEA